MSKTPKVHPALRGGILLFSVWLVGVCAPGVVAQQGAAKSQSSKSISAGDQPTVKPAKASQTTVDRSIPDDPALESLIEPYRGKVRALDVVIGNLQGELTREGPGAGSLGNFVADGIRSLGRLKMGQPIDLVIVNAGGLRKSAIAPGNLRIRDIFELLPFENKLVTLELNGQQLVHVLQIIVAREAQSGARLQYHANENNRAELVQATLVDTAGKERPIDPRATYRVLTVDYLLNVVGGSLAILKEGNNQKPLGITIRDAIIEYVKAETAAGRKIKPTLDGRLSAR